MAEEINKPNGEEVKTEDSIAERLAKLEIENKKLKSAMDKASSEAADYKKKWKATQSDAEQRAMEKAEAEAQKDERIAQLERESKINKFAKQYATLGYSDIEAEEAATAQYDGDTDTLFRIQSAHNENLKATIKADLMKSMPTPPTGSESETSITKEQFESMGYLEQVEFKRNYPETYKKYSEL